MVNPCGLWVDTGQPHDTSALALLLMQDCSRYLSMLGIFAAEEQLLESVDVFYNFDQELKCVPLFTHDLDR